MKIAVIGSRGFIGSACLAHFANGHEVFGADIHPSSRSDYYQVSDTDSLIKFFELNSFDVCINASGSANVGFSFANRDKDYELNVANVQTIVDSISKYQPNCRLINFSSAAVYGNPIALPIREDFATVPLSPYGEHKLLAETVLSNAFAERGVKGVSLRVFSAFGPGLYKQLFWDIYKKWQVSKTITLFGTGKESRDFIYVSDLVRAVESVVHSANFTGEVYNVASGAETSIQQAASTFLLALGTPYELVFSGEEKAGDPINWKADIFKLKSLGFDPQVDLQLGLAHTAADYLRVSQ